MMKAEAIATTIHRPRRRPVYAMKRRMVPKVQMSVWVDKASDLEGHLLLSRRKRRKRIDLGHPARKGRA
jgi:hypothetical protein